MLTLTSELGRSGGLWVKVFCTGTFERTLDDKHRLLLPKPVRKSLQSAASLFVTPGQDQCLELHSLESIQQRSDEIARTSSGRIRKSFSRLYFAQAEKCELDAQCRIRIPQRLIEWADLESRVVVVGTGEHWEIWHEEHWQRYCDDHKQEFDLAGESETSRFREANQLLEHQEHTGKPR